MEEEKDEEEECYIKEDEEKEVKLKEEDSFLPNEFRKEVNGLRIV